MLASLLGRGRCSPRWRQIPARCKASLYQKKTPVEHVLLRPGMYVGQVESASTETWLYIPGTKRMSKRPTVYNPALLKIFDEILVNAADNKQRDGTMSYIDVSVARTADGFTVSIENDGKSLPIEVHEEENIYIPELVFGHMLTGSNFNDNENRLTGGSHGYGAKLTNIFSNSFQVEVQDGNVGLNYRQEWRNNMSKVCAPVVKHTANGKKSFTKVTFEPDLMRFGGWNDVTKREELITQAIELFQRRALDVAACIAPVDVRFSVVDAVTASVPDPRYSIPRVGSFRDYVRLFERPSHAPEVAEAPEAPEAMVDLTSGALTDGGDGDLELGDPSSLHESSDVNSRASGGSMVYCEVNQRWEVAVGESTTGAFESMSFVNSVWTVRGGTHVNAVSAQIVKAIEAALAKKGVQATPTAIRNKLMVFVNCKIENPAFDGQTKDALNTKPGAFGSTCKLPDKFLKDLLARTGIVDSLAEEISFKEQSRLLKRTKGGKRLVIDVPKLEDAHAAGGSKALQCTLILTEGDSAKALAVSGLEVVGRELFGVMPLRGKVLNVRSAPLSQVHKNEEFINLCKALGLDFLKTYESGLEGQGLRYGKVLIMCDQDTDGSHIKGLVINMFQRFWPALLRHDSFLQQFITPLVKTRAKTGSKEAHAFFSVPEFKQWQESHKGGAGDDGSEAVPEEKYTVKYYKGLGTSTAAEGREYFAALAHHRKSFEPLNAEDADAIEMAFSRERAAHRRDWLATTHDPQAFLDPHLTSVSYRDFINKELIHFSFADNHRSIPSAIDGLKPSQRKVLYGCFKKKLTREEVKVAQLSGYIAEHTAYHHDEGSLSTTIINMAQDFVGSNNVPLLEAAGQFGTRAQGGKDYASPRYVFTKLSPIARKLFPEEDDGLLQYVQEDGQTVEPTYFLPVVPTLLLNGSQGIGTGWSTTVPTFNLAEVVEHVRCCVRGQVPTRRLQPYVQGFRGAITPLDADPVPVRYATSGVITRAGPTEVVITELPCGVWTGDYKQYLLKMAEAGAIKKIREKHTSETVHFEITASADALNRMTQKSGGLLGAFRLTSTISLSNMHAFDRNGKIRKFASAEEIVDEHFAVRHEGYMTRKEQLERKHAAEELRSRNRSRFIERILSGEIEILSGARRVGSSESELVHELRRQGFADEAQIAQVLSGVPTSAGASGGGFGYLLDMPIHFLTQERSLQLQTRAQEAGDRLEIERRRTTQDLWLSDLDGVSCTYESLLAKRSKPA